MYVIYNEHSLHIGLSVSSLIHYTCQMYMYMHPDMHVHVRPSIH